MPIILNHEQRVWPVTGTSWFVTNSGPAGELLQFHASPSPGFTSNSCAVMTLAFRFRERTIARRSYPNRIERPHVRKLRLPIGNPNIWDKFEAHAIGDCPVKERYLSFFLRIPAI